MFLMRAFLVFLLAAGLVACGPKARKSDKRSAEQISADAIGVPLLQFRQMVAEEQETMRGLDAKALRDGSQAGCAKLRGTPEQRPCLVRQRASVELLTEKKNAVLSGDPAVACTDTRVQMGASTEEALRVCGQFSAACQREYADRYWRWADRVSVGLLGAQGKGYFKCKAADETLFAGAVFRKASFDQMFRGRTSMSADPCHGEQIEYNAPDGKAYLWYGTNADVVVGEWAIVSDEGDPRVVALNRFKNGDPVPKYCQRYQGNTYNPATKKRGGRWECIDVFLLTRGRAASAEGDVFGLSEGGAVPHRLRGNLPTRFRGYANPYPGAACKDGRVVRGG